MVIATSQLLCELHSIFIYLFILIEPFVLMHCKTLAMGYGNSKRLLTKLERLRLDLLKCGMRENCEVSVIMSSNISIMFLLYAGSR